MCLQENERKRHFLLSLGYGDPSPTGEWYIQWTDPLPGGKRPQWKTEKGRCRTGTVETKTGTCTTCNSHGDLD